MKKIVLFLTIAIFGLVAFTGCKKDPKTGDLYVICKDGVGTLLDAETVYLYTSQSDFDNAVYTKSATTDATGTAKFYELAPGSYWVDCDFANEAGTITTIDGVATVSADHVTTITIEP